MSKAGSLRLLATGLALAAGLATLAGPAGAQDYPDRAITLYTTGSGGPSDLAARILAEELHTSLGQPVIVQNRPSNQLVEEVAQQKPDGYSLMITGNSMWTAPLIRKTQYEAQKDFTPISLLSVQPTEVLVGPQSEYKTLEELLAKAKANPGQVRYSAAGIGGTSHIAAELFKSMAGVDIEGVFYKSNSEQQLGLMRGEVDMNIGIAATAKNLVDQGQLKALAVATLEPTPLVPGLPTIAASGVPGYEYVSMSVMFAPAGTPDAIIRKVNEAVVKAMTNPAVKEKMAELGADVIASSPEQLGQTMTSDIERISKLIADGKIPVDK